VAAVREADLAVRARQLAEGGAAALLAALEAPTTGQTLARRLGVSPSALSQHVTAVRDGGLVATQWSGRHVLCPRTDLGDRLATRS
jgi:DNA-binding transcriptional ArsR family regulator